MSTVDRPKRTRPDGLPGGGVEPPTPGSPDTLPWFHPDVPVDRRSSRRAPPLGPQPSGFSATEPAYAADAADSTAAADADRRASVQSLGFDPDPSSAARHHGDVPQPAVALTPEASLRIFRLFLVARAALGSAIAAGQLMAGLLGAWASTTVLSLVFLQAGAAVLLWWWPASKPDAADVRDVNSWRGLRRRAWLATIGVDLACFGSLHLLSTGGGPNYGALLVLPVLMAGVFMPRVPALGVAVGVTLLLLAAASWGQSGAGDFSTSVAQAGLAGMGLVLATWLASELTARLQREEAAARGSQERARQEAQLNRLVIDEMRDGVMVVDRNGWVRRANPAARALIAATGGGPEPPFQLRGVAVWQELAGGIETGFAGAAGADRSLDVMLTFEPGYRRTLRMRPRFTLRRGSREREVEELCVLFLEDLRDVQARSRQERLAAMGRVSAGIAHEIRNPLAAIAQANALLLEDATDASQQRLTRMVADNVERLKRIVEDVLNVTPTSEDVVAPIDARALVETVCADWARTNRVTVGQGGVLQVDLPYNVLHVVFDAEHLRRVVVNLLDNAHRHATRTAASVRVRMYERSLADAALLVVNDGETIPPDVERHLFEPFFSTRSRGTGLGLYICRELCHRYGARIDYRQRPGPDGARNEFHVVMRRADARTLPAEP
jgi:two-component system, NtrC family, sensor histidine kinase PilS